MINKTVYLKEIFGQLAESGCNPVMSTYVLENSKDINPLYKRPCVLICPGGSYEFTSDREAEPVAMRFAAAGFHAFVLRYSVAPHRFPTQLLEISAALAYIRSMEEEWNIDKERVAVCGFSAGGHLAGSLGVFWQQDFIREKLGIAYGENRPDAVILAYPVITGGEFAHPGSMENLLGKNHSIEQRDRVSLELHVSGKMPPTFIWHTQDDPSVPVENSMLLANALQENRIQFELHLYSKGVHGLSLCDKSSANVDRPDHINPHAGSWFALAIEWLKEALQM